MMMIEKALVSDVETLRSAAISAFLDDEQYKPVNAISGGPPGHDTVESHIQWIINYDYFKCVIHDQIIGGCIVRTHSCHYELFGIFLHRSKIGKGLGSDFLQGVIKLYPDGAHWTLETPDYSKRNQKFYERNGFIASRNTAQDPKLGFGFIIYHRPAQPGTAADSQGRGIFSC